MSAQSSSRTFLRRVAKLAEPLWPQLALIVLLSLLSTPIALLGPVPLKIAVDSIFGHKAVPDFLQRFLPGAASATDTNKLFTAAGLLLAVSIISNLQALASWLLQTYTGEKLVHEFRSQLLWHAQRLSLAFHDRRGAADTSYRIQHDAPAIQFVVLQGALPILNAAFSFAAMLYVTSRMSTRLALLAVLLSPVLYILSRQSSRRVRTGAIQVRELDSSAMLVLNEALIGVRAVKAYGRELEEHQSFRRRSRQRMSQQIRLASVQASFHVLIGLTIAIGMAAALWLGVREVESGAITVGELLLILAYMGQLYEPLRTISSKIPELQTWIVSVQRAFTILDEVPELEAEDNVPAVRRAQGAFIFQSVSFRYPGSSRWALENINLEIPSGSSVGILGPSGSGKSSLLNLLTRFYDPIDGDISLDGISLRRYGLRDLRNQFALVLQEPFLFSMSIAGNIAYGRPDATREEVIAAAIAANAHEFILATANGYETLIGEGGVRLSGGERQRISLARAFLRDSPIMILDEPTSAVDVESEKQIVDAFQRISAGRTTFTIAHRLSTLERCDLLVVLDKAQVVAVTSQYDEAVGYLRASTSA